MSFLQHSSSLFPAVFYQNKSWDNIDSAALLGQVHVWFVEAIQKGSKMMFT